LIENHLRHLTGTTADQQLLVLRGVVHRYPQKFCIHLFGSIFFGDRVRGSDFRDFAFSILGADSKHASDCRTKRAQSRWTRPLID